MVDMVPNGGLKLQIKMAAGPNVHIPHTNRSNQCKSNVK